MMHFHGISIQIATWRYLGFIPIQRVRNASQPNHLHVIHLKVKTIYQQTIKEKKEQTAKKYIL